MVEVDISTNFLFVFLFRKRIVGATVKDSVDLKFLYENHPEFSPLPTYFIMPALMLSMTSSLVASAIKHTEFDLSQVLHGEQYLEVFDQLPTEGELTTTASILDVTDKRSGAVVVADCMLICHNLPNRFDECAQNLC